MLHDSSPATRPADRDKPDKCASSAPLQTPPATRKTFSSASLVGHELPLQSSRRTSSLRRVTQRSVQIEFLQALAQIEIVGRVDDAMILNQLEQFPLRQHLRDL